MEVSLDSLCPDLKLSDGLETFGSGRMFLGVLACCRIPLIREFRPRQEYIMELSIGRGRHDEVRLKGLELAPIEIVAVAESNLVAREVPDVTRRYCQTIGGRYIWKLRQKRKTFSHGDRESWSL